MRKNKEAVENAECQGRHGEKVHCRNYFPMIAQKSRQSLCRLWTSRISTRPTQHSPLRNIEAKHFQLAKDPGRTPGPVRGNHAEDAFAQFPAHRLSSCPSLMPREPRPIQFETGSVPSRNRRRLGKNQRLLPAAPNPPQDNPKQSVGTRESRPRMPSPQDRRPLPKRHVFQDQIPARAKESSKCGKQKSQPT
jgi:hypothetical protein